ncbi:MAG: c-type cytochrome [Myxococcota bacterium]|nr:c-type cytochrome [Myxococcota bacterium]
MVRALPSLWLLAGLVLMPGLAPAQDYGAKGFKLEATTPRESSQENVAAGKVLYGEYCSQCHGDAGDGNGVMADRLRPRPRDFRRAIYKIRRTMQGELPIEEDLFEIIGKGMPGTSMPAWRGLLSDEQIWQLVDYLKGFSIDFEDYPAEQELVLEGKLEATPESIARGREVYEKAECEKCHGAFGRGDGPSAPTLEDEWENKIYPADLTQPWTLRGGASVEDLYRTMTTGVNGTPMPSFSDAWNAEDLWHLANYLHSIGREPVWGEIVRGVKVDAIPEDPFSDDWSQAPELDIRLAGQIIQRPRLFNPSVQSLTVQAMFDENELALLLTWNDKVDNDGQNEAPSDQVSVMFPVEELKGGKKPYFLMGDRRNSVDAWQWAAGGGVETLLGRGMDDVVARSSPVRAQGEYRDGQYRVILRRSLQSDGDDEIAFVPGRMIPIAWNVWDGDNEETGKQRAVSRWYYLLLEPETPLTTYLWPLVVVLLAGGGEWVGLRRLRQQWASRAPEGSPPPGVSES